MNPEWEELASRVTGYVKIAYWDTEKSGAAPSILGEIRGTPTIKLLRPKRKAKTNKQKDVVDYNMERKASDSKCCFFVFGHQRQAQSIGSNFLTLIISFVILEQTLPVATFSLDLMPSFVERINGSEDFQKFKTKATKYGLPMMLFFSEDRRILNEMKFLSTEFRRRVLVAQVRAFSVDVRKKSHLPLPIRCSLRSLLSLSDPIYKERK